MSGMTSKLLLDTCGLLWLAAGSNRLSKETLYTIDNAPIAYVSAISAWEISLKAERGQLKLPMPVREWFISALEQHSLMLASLDVDILFAANQLPWHHRDPADRFIIATALNKGAVVVTGDDKFSMYEVDTIC